MTAVTDYDARRTSVLDDIEPLDTITPARADTQSPSVDLDDDDTAEGVEPPGADLSGEELTMPVIPKRADEFTCTSCFLVLHRSRRASSHSESFVCIDCV